jgi:hypothetical protein
VRYVNDRGESHGLRLKLLGVTGDAGQRLEVTRSRRRHEDDLKIWVPGAADAVRTVVIRYSVGRAVRFFEDHDELYWNVTGDEWPYPIGAASATILLPRSLDNIRVNAFTGGHRSTERGVAITVDGEPHGPEDAFVAAGESTPPPVGDRHVVKVEATRPLGIREGLTVAVAWNPGGVRRPTAFETRLAWFFDNAGALTLAGLVTLIPLATFGVMLRLWWKKGKDPRPGPMSTIPPTTAISWLFSWTAPSKGSSASGRRRRRAGFRRRNTPSICSSRQTRGKTFHRRLRRSCGGCSR